MFPGDVDKVIEWQIWEGVHSETSTSDYILKLNDELVFQVTFIS